MTKRLACGDVVPGCAFKVSATGEAELLEKVAEHAAEAHGVKEITPELAIRVRAAIKDA